MRLKILSKIWIADHFPNKNSYSAIEQSEMSECFN